MNRVLAGRELTASLPSPEYKSAASCVYMRWLPFPLNCCKAIYRKSEIALLSASVESSAVSFSTYGLTGNSRRIQTGWTG
jgi:hypothetical protein